MPRSECWVDNRYISFEVCNITKHKIIHVVGTNTLYSVYIYIPVDCTVFTSMPHLAWFSVFTIAKVKITKFNSPSTNTEKCFL